MTFTVTADELKELSTALMAHHSGLVHELAQGCYIGGPNEAGIQKCIRRQKVEHLMDRLRELASPKPRAAVLEVPVLVAVPQRKAA